MEISPGVSSLVLESRIVSEDAAATRPQGGTHQEKTEQRVEGDRVTVLKTQNAAAAVTEMVDVENAFRVLEQVIQEMPRLRSEDLAQLYHYDHLRSIFAV